MLQQRPQTLHHQLTHIHEATAATATTKQQLVVVTIIIICLASSAQVKAGVFYPRGGSFGYLAAVAIPVDLPNRNIYMAFNFESNYGLPSNDSYNEWIDRWDLDEQFLSLGNNVTAINGRHLQERSSPRRSLLPRYDRRSFYRTFTGYLDHYQMNGTGCLLRTICEVAATSLEENNGVLGSILKILFMPTTSRREATPLHNDVNDHDLYQAEWQGRQYLANTMEAEAEEEQEKDDYGGTGGNGDVSNACLDYSHWCPEGVINMISDWY